MPSTETIISIFISGPRLKQYVTNLAFMINTNQDFRTLKFVSLILLISHFSIDINGQSISTVGEIYDYEINDIFHTRESGSFGWNEGFVSFENIQISDKYYSADSDTVFYIRSVTSEYSGSNQPDPSSTSFVDTVFYTNLNSLIANGSMDSVYTSEFYNGRTVNFNETPIVNYWYHNKTYIEGCGGPYYTDHWSGDDEGYDTDHRLRLFYFKKGLEEWGVPYYITGIENPNFHHQLKIYPIPASNQLKLDLGVQNYGSCSGIIYTSSGKQIEEFSFSSIGQKQIDISGLSKGFYIIRLNIEGDFLSATFVKI